MPKYETVWRNKFLTINATSMDDMIDTYRSVLETFENMREAGVTLEGGQDCDYALLVTEDPGVAEKFGFEPVDDEDEEYEY